MGKPKGSPKTGGRKAGTPNKDNPLKQILRDHSLAYFAKDSSGLSQFDKDILELPPDQRVMAELKALRYHTPELKAVDIEASVREVPQSIVELVEELAK